jgi:isopentenyl diphosphate isomerase/L-lactate dehydrogenase-like FMN-dependent dehydrogenase
MVRLGEAAGYSTLVLTTEVGANRNRERDLRNHCGLPMNYTPKPILDGVLHPRWSLIFMLTGMPQLASFVNANASDLDMQVALVSRQMDASFNWYDLAWLRNLWPRRLVVKGIMRPDDAERCIAGGAGGVMLSNHGGGTSIPVSRFSKISPRRDREYPRRFWSTAGVVAAPTSSRHWRWARTPCLFDERRSMVWPPLAMRASITSCASSRTRSTEPRPRPVSQRSTSSRSTTSCLTQ